MVIRLTTSKYVSSSLIPQRTLLKKHATPPRELLFLNEAAAARLSLSLFLRAALSRSPVSLIIPTLALTSYPAAAANDDAATALAERKNPSTNYNQFKWRSREEKRRAHFFTPRAPLLNYDARGLLGDFLSSSVAVLLMAACSQKC